MIRVIWVKQIKVLLKEIDSEAEDLLKQTQNIFDILVSQLWAIITTENIKLKEALKVVVPNSPNTLQVNLKSTVHDFSSIQALVRSYYYS